MVKPFSKWLTPKSIFHKHPSEVETWIYIYSIHTWSPIKIEFQVGFPNHSLADWTVVLNLRFFYTYTFLRIFFLYNCLELIY